MTIRQASRPIILMTKQALWLAVCLTAAGLTARAIFAFDPVNSAHWSYLFAHSLKDFPKHYLYVSGLVISVWLLGFLKLRKKGNSESAKKEAPLADENTQVGSAEPGSKNVLVRLVHKSLSNLLEKKKAQARAQRDRILEEETSEQSSEASEDSVNEQQDEDYQDFISLVPVDDDDINLLGGKETSEYAFFQDLRRTKNISEGDLSACVQMWLQNNKWILRLDAAINGDMGPEEFEEDSFGDASITRVPMLALDDQCIRLFAFVSPKGAQVTVPDEDTMLQGPLGTWLIQNEENPLEVDCPVGLLMMAKNRLIAAYGTVIERIYGSTDCISPTLVLGDGTCSNTDALVELVNRGELDIIHFMTPGSIPDMLSESPAEIGAIHHNLLKEIIAGDLDI